MCFLCDILGVPSDREYFEVSAGALKNSTVEVFGMVAQIPPAQVVLFPLGARAVFFYS
jgi:hypothetical protein